jgi:hypothetical protein
MSSYQATYVERLTQEIERTPAEYLPALLELIRLFRQSVTLKPAADSFRKGWQEAMAGETMPVDELWLGMDEQ